MATTTDALVAVLRESILAGALPPGARLREEALAREHGVGRYTLRAAFRELAAAGLVVVRPNRGAVVATPTGAEGADLHAFRSALERGALDVALERGAGFAAARAELARLEAMAADEPWSHVADVHHAIHAAIVDAAGSRRLSAAYASLRTELLFFVTRIRPSYDVAAMVAAHRRLVAGLASGDPARARAALAADLADGARALAAVPATLGSG